MEPHPSSSVDTSRPFRSVKEAVSVFGERILAGTNNPTYTVSPVSSAPKPTYYAISPPKPARSVSSSSRTFSSFLNQESEEEIVIINSIKKLEVELEETKKELALLKERESEREIAVASLNAKLHKNLSNISVSETSREARDAKRRVTIEERWREEDAKFEYLPCLAEALSIGDMEENYGGGRRKPKMRKKKPIVPLIGDLFSKKKPPNEFDSSLFSRPFYSAIS